MTTTTTPQHPAKFTPSIVHAIGEIVLDYFAPPIFDRPPVLLDPFAGVGGIHALRPSIETYGVELEPEWAAASEHTQVGDALNLTEWGDGSVDVVATSPCLAQHHRILTSDLQWIPAGDVTPGLEVMAFDEHGIPGATGRNARRRWRRATVVRSVPRATDTVRVILANGDSITTTPEHPWLASVGTGAPQWLTSAELTTRRAPSFVHLQVRPWRQQFTREAGWLAGMYDGEGSLSLGSHGSPKLTIYQLDGPVMDHAERLLEQHGFDTNRIARTDPVTADHGRKVHNLYVSGGFPGIMRALGMLRPMRLLDKWAELDVSTRTVEAERVEVVAVEPAGVLDIQEIETSTGTYIGEGYLHHNCYGNRMADHHNAVERCRPCGGSGKAVTFSDHALAAGVLDDCAKCEGTGRRDHQRITYRHRLGRDLTAGSSAEMQWGSAYRRFHIEAWQEALRVVRPGGLFIVNVKDHVRKDRLQRVPEWHVQTLQALGARLYMARPVDTPGMGFGANADARAEFELVVTFLVGADDGTQVLPL